MVMMLALPALILCQTNDKNAGKKGGSEQAVRQTLDDLIAGLGRNDTAALDRIYADNYTFVGDKGMMMTKAERITAMKSGDLKYESISHEVVSVHLFRTTFRTRRMNRDSLWEVSMKLRGMVLAVCVAVLGAGIVPAGAQAKDPALDKLAADWAAAFAKGDAKALAGFYTDDAVRASQEAGTVVGRAAIEKEFAANFAGPWKGAKIAIKVGSIHPVGTDIAVNEGTWEVSGTGPDGKPMTMAGYYVNTLVKRAGAWVIAGNAAVTRAPAAAR